MKHSLEHHLPKLVLAPAFVLGLAFIYGFMIWNGALSVTASRMLPNYEFVGGLQYERLWAMERSFVVTGTAWKWILNPSDGLQKVMQDLGWTSFTFDWLVQSDLAIYCVVIAGVWQSAGFAMALFLAGLRGVDDSIIKAAQIDGASLPRIYWRIVLPTLKPVFFSTLMVLSHLAIKSFDLVMALTSGGPGYATDVPATFMYAMSFSRGQIGLGAASATIMLVTVAAIVVPYLYSELRSKPR